MNGDMTRRARGEVRRLLPQVSRHPGIRAFRHLGIYITDDVFYQHFNSTTSSILTDSITMPVSQSLTK